jgi:putative FmdB family regulatory protein
VPVYAFTCAGCGPFEVVRPMVEASVPAYCPTCGGEARRVFTPPGLACLAGSVRRALEMEERSAHEPEVVSEKRGRPLPHRHTPAPPWTLAH